VSDFAVGPLEQTRGNYLIELSDEGVP